MANAFTTLGFTKPEVGADTNLWGGHINTDMDQIDALFQRFVGTTTTHLMTLNVTGVSTTTTRTLIIQDASGTVPLVAAHTTQVFTSTTGTYTPNANMYCCIIQCVAGGGGGGSSNAPAGLAYVAGGGGAGGYSQTITTAAAVGTSQAVAIGAGGAGGASGANSGSAGGDTSVGALCIAKGGSGGLLTVNGASAPGLGGAGGVAGTGDVTKSGIQGGPGGIMNYVHAILHTGFGAPSVLGGGVSGGSNNTAPVVGVSAPANSGAGGSGAWCLNGANTAGGAGGSGFVVITEFLKK